MLAAVLRDFNRLELEDLPVPAPRTNEVVVRVKACGICQTDYKAITGRRRNFDFPMVAGHEISGIVSAVGGEVREFKEGDEVIVQPSGFCGTCRHCRVGLHHYCKRAFVIGGDGPPDVRPGGFAEYTKITETSVYHKPSSVSFESAALAEPLAGAWKGTIQYSNLRIGEDMVVIGVGSIGLLVVMVAARAGAGTVVAVDVSDYALAEARKLGATHGVNPEKENPREAVYGILPEGPDVVLEAAGPIEAVRLMFELRRMGTRLNLFGITTPEEACFNGGEAHFLETRMDASFGVTPMAMTHAIRLMERGLVDPGSIISHTFPLSKIHDAMKVMGERERNKVMILP